MRVSSPPWRNEDCDGLAAGTATNSVANQAGVAGVQVRGKGLVISTSTTDDLTHSSTPW